MMRKKDGGKSVVKNQTEHTQPPHWLTVTIGNLGIKAKRVKKKKKAKKTTDTLQIEEQVKELYNHCLAKHTM